MLVITGCMRHVRPPEQFRYSYRRGSVAVERSLESVDSISVADYPKSVTISPDQRLAYVCNLEHGSVDVLETASGRRVRRLIFRRTPVRVIFKRRPLQSFEEKPVEVAFTRRGKSVWISLLNAGGVVVYSEDRLRPPAPGEPFKIVDVYGPDNKRLRTVRLPLIPTGKQPKIIATSPDERRVFVANWLGQTVTVVDAQKLRPLKNIRVGWLPRGICFVDGRAYVANFGGHSISEIDLGTLKVRRTWRGVGRNPRHLVASRNGAYLYVSNHGDDRVREINRKTGRVTRVCQVGGEPRTISLSRNKNFLFVVNYQDDTLTAVDLRTMTPAVTVPTLRRPVGVAVEPRSDTVWVTGYWDRAVRRYRFESTTGDLTNIEDPTPEPEGAAQASALLGR